MSKANAQLNWDLFKGSQFRAGMMLLVVMLSSIIFDQVTKIHAHRDLLIWQDEQDDEMFRGRKHEVFLLGSREMVDGKRTPFFGMNYQYSRNKGAAFSMFSTLDERIRVPLFHAITIMAVIFISYFYVTTLRTQYLMRYGLALILAGAIGNFLDRVTRGYVIDFIDVDWNIFGWYVDFAIFNIADVSINIGVYCMVIQMLYEHFRDRKTKDSSQLQPEV